MQRRRHAGAYGWEAGDATTAHHCACPLALPVCLLACILSARPGPAATQVAPGVATLANLSGDSVELTLEPWSVSVLLLQVVAPPTAQAAAAA